MLHLILEDYAFRYMLCAKLIRCHRTKLISAATLACMGRPWFGLSLCSLMRITKEGRLCVRGYPGPVSGDSLESRFGLVPVWENVVCHAMAGVSGGHGATQGMAGEVGRVIL